MAKFTGDPKATTFAALRTPRQLAMFSRMDRYDGIDVDARCQELLGCKTAELSVKAASWLIGVLKAEQGRAF